MVAAVNPAQRPVWRGVSSAQRPKIGLAHVGVIRALADVGMQIDCIAGTSMGALIGAVHAAGKMDELETSFLGFD